MFFQPGQGVRVGAEEFRLGPGKTGEQGKNQADLLFFPGKGMEQFPDQLVHQFLVVGGEQVRIRRLQLPEVPDSLADGKQLVFPDGLIGHGMVQIGDFPAAGGVFPETEGTALVALEIHFVGGIRFHQGRHLDQPQSLCQRTHQGPFLALPAGNQLILALPENGGNPVPAFRLHFLPGPQPDHIRSQMGQQRIRIRFFKIGMEDGAGQLEQFLFDGCHGNSSFQGYRGPPLG